MALNLTAQPCLTYRGSCLYFFFFSRPVALAQFHILLLLFSIISFPTSFVILLFLVWLPPYALATFLFGGAFIPYLFYSSLSLFPLLFGGGFIPYLTSLLPPSPVLLCGALFLGLPFLFPSLIPCPAPPCLRRHVYPFPLFFFPFLTPIPPRPPIYSAVRLSLAFSLITRHFQINGVGFPFHSYLRRLEKLAKERKEK